MRICWCTPYGMFFDTPESARRKDYVQSTMLEHMFLKSEIDMNVVSLARNTIVETVLADESIDVLWWVDSDILLPDNASELLQYVTDECPVVSGLYISRRFPYFPQAYFKATHHERGNHPYIPLVDIPIAPTHVDAVGAGFMMVKRSVFIELAEQYDQDTAILQTYLDEVKPPGGVVRALHLAQSLKPWFEFLGRVGEDFYFCEQLARIGITPLLVPNVVAKHVGPQEIGLEQFLAMKQAGLVYLD